MRLIEHWQSLATSALLLPAAFAELPQSATAGDIRIMERYVGEFRSPPHHFDDGKTEYYHLVKYQWFDRTKTIVKFTISMVIPSQNRVLTTAEGFYGYDSVEKRLYVFGAFSHGTSGWGSICEFDHATGTRTVCARSMEPDGSLTHVRDSFEIVDADTWKNTTRIRKDGSGDWELAYEGTYRRVDDD
jgi:hypothetical protein